MASPIAPDVMGLLSGDPLIRDPDDELVAKIHNRWRDANDHQQDWREKAKTNYDMYAGDQWDVNDQMKLRDEDRQPVTFNRIGIVVDAIVGTEINNRQETRYIPREQGDIQINELISGAADWVRDECDAEDEESDAFRDMVICGMGWTETRIAYDQDPEGKIFIERVDPMEMWYDPAAKKKNVVDASWLIRVKKVDRNEATQLFPKLLELDLDARMAHSPAPWDGFDDDTGQLREHVYPQDAYKADRTGATDGEAGTTSDRINIAQYQWFEWITTYRVESPQAPGGFEELAEDQFKRVKLMIEFRGLQYIKQRKRVPFTAFVFGPELLHTDKAPAESGFSLRSMTGKRDRNNNHWFGIVNAMEDPQRWANKFFSQILHIVNTNSKGGVMIEDDAVENMREFESNWANASGVTIVAQGALSGGKIQQKDPAAYPQSLDRLMEYAVSSIRDTAGASLEMLGMADRDQPGVLEYQRRQSGITILAVFFDAIRKYRKEQGRVLMEYMRKFISDGRLIRIIGESGNQQYVPLFKMDDTLKFDVIVDESPTSPNQREKVFAVLQALLPAVMQAGMPIPPELLDYAPIPSVLAEKWKAMIQQGGQLPPEAQQQMNNLMEENQELKSKRQEKMAELQVKKQEIEMKMALAQREHNDEMRLDIQKMREELQMQWQKLEAEIAMERAKITADERNRQFALSQAREASKGPRRKIKVQRGEDGLIMSAEIEEVFDAA